jgi:potassium-transporting ATPase potassium-binding subunit
MWSLPISLLLITTILAFPLSRYAAWIMNGQYRAPKVLQWFEAKLNSGAQNWKQYAVSLLIFNIVLFIYGFGVLWLQGWSKLPLNDLHRGMLAPSTIFNSVISFMTNTNLQHYSGDQHFSNFAQIFFCIANQFLSAAARCGGSSPSPSPGSPREGGSQGLDRWHSYGYAPLHPLPSRAFPAKRMEMF